MVSFDLYSTSKLKPTLHYTIVSKDGLGFSFFCFLLLLSIWKVVLPLYPKLNHNDPYILTEYSFDNLFDMGQLVMSQ